MMWRNIGSDLSLQNKPIHMISYDSPGKDEPYCILLTLKEKYNAYIILLHGRIDFKTKCERRKMSSTNFKLCLLKVTILTYMFKHIEIY